MATSTSPTTMKKIERAHQMYREGKYEDALGYYTEALSMAKTKPQKIALHSNRAACFLKLHLFQKAAEECTWVLELDHKHTGALMLRAQTLVTLKEYQSALFDVNRLIELNSSSDVYRNLQSRLKTQLSLATIPEADTELEEEEDENEYEVKVEEMKEEEVKLEKKDDIKEKNENILKGEKIEKASEKSVSWQAIAKPKGHSRLDYSRWDQVEDDSSEDEDDDENCQPQYRFRVRKVGVHAVK